MFVLNNPLFKSERSWVRAKNNILRYNRKRVIRKIQIFGNSSILNYNLVCINQTSAKEITCVFRSWSKFSIWSKFLLFRNKFKYLRSNLVIFKDWRNSGWRYMFHSIFCIVLLEYKIEIIKEMSMRVFYYFELE